MDALNSKLCTAFLDGRKIGEGRPRDVALIVKRAIERDAAAAALVFDDESGRALEFDLRGSQDDVRARLDVEKGRKPGRPRLGVTAREVTLLARHWDWLALQPGGASAALRRLVDRARAEGGADLARLAQENAHRFMSAALGDAPDYEEAMRALFACDAERFDELSAKWPADLAAFARKLAAPAFEPAAAALLARSR